MSSWNSALHPNVILVGFLTISAILTQYSAARVDQQGVDKMKILADNLNLKNSHPQGSSPEKITKDSASQIISKNESYFSSFNGHKLHQYLWDHFSYNYAGYLRPPVQGSFNWANNLRPPVQGSFNWGNCGQASDSLEIDSFTVTPDPISLPGEVNLAFDVIVRESIDAPVKVSITLQKKILFFWITVPCMDGVGSCYYEDLCEKMQSFNCPEIFTELNIPCKCPFANGSYSLPATPFYLGLSAPGGYYYVKASLSTDSQSVSCFEAYFSVAGSKLTQEVSNSIADFNNCSIVYGQLCLSDSGPHSF